MVKSVDTRDLKSLGESCPGSSPGERTIIWCNTHNRLASECKYKGGILLPCCKVNLLEHLELVSDEDLSCVKLAE